MPNTNKIYHDLDCDVVVIGAGVAGLGAGYFLSEKAKVIVLEQEDQPAYQSSGRSAALYIEGYENPVVGPDSNSNGFFWLAGQGGFGVQTSPALGKLTADSILNNKPIEQTIHRQRFKRNNWEAEA